MRNYNNELESILEKKSFSVDAKNILLNMLYKIEVSYDDYYTVKRNVEDKKSFIEKILSTIDECNDIILMKPVKNEKNENIYCKYKIDRENEKIEVYPNEEAMLYALNDYHPTKMYLSDDYKLIRHSLPKLINTGREINNTEIIRDFDAWSWNIQVDEIISIETNLIYQNLQILLGYKKLNELIENKALKTTLLPLEECLKEIYGEDNTKRLLNLIYKLSIIIDVNEDEVERKRLYEQKVWIEKEYNRLDNKKKLLDDITNSKKIIFDKVKDIDIILNNKERLLEEYNKRNEKLPEHSKIFSLSHFSEILLRERKQELDKMNEYNKILEPKNYTFIKSKFENDLNLLSNIKLDGKIKNSTLKLMLALQELFLDCIDIQIEKLDNKKDIFNYMYIIRYYNFLPFDKNTLIKDVKELKGKLLSVKNSIIKKIFYYKIINKNMELNIVDNIFNTKINCIENIEFEFENKNGEINLNFYDEESIAETIKIDIHDIDINTIKFNKKMKLFN